jgi:hypothetical protein
MDWYGFPFVCLAGVRINECCWLLLQRREGRRRKGLCRDAGARGGKTGKDHTWILYSTIGNAVCCVVRKRVALINEAMKESLLIFKS